MLNEFVHMEKKASFKELINGDKPVLVDFYATWCGPCKAMGPVLKELTEEVGEKAHIIKVDIDKNRAAAENFGIMGVPTFMIFKDGKMQWRQSGMLPKSALVNVIDQYA
ncbi:MAG: thioredoxin [Bacteroidota bacterium]